MAQKLGSICTNVSILGMKNFDFWVKKMKELLSKDVGVQFRTRRLEAKQNLEVLQT